MTKQITIQSYTKIGMDFIEVLDQLCIFGDLLPVPLSQRMKLESYAKKIIKYAEIWFAVQEGTGFVGMMIFYANDNRTQEAHMPMIAIKPDCRNAGLGKTMMQRAIAIARTKGMRSFSLEVRPDNRVAQRLYRSLGFRFTKRTGSSWHMLLQVGDEPENIKSMITPLHESHALAAAFDLDIDLRLKRDDYYPMAGGGIKARKIKHIVKHAIAKGYTALVTNGGTQSNHARATAIAAATHGLHCHLVVVLNTENKHPNTGNILLMQLAGATIEYCKKENLSDSMDRAIEHLEKIGHKPLYIWGGGHCVQGITPFVEAVDEVTNQDTQWSPDFMIHASATGSTQAGFAIGYHDSPTHVIGVSVARNKQRGSAIVEQCVTDYYSHFKLAHQNVYIDFRDDWIAGGYEIYNEELFSIVERAAKCGILLDPTYSGKAFHGLVDLVRRGEISAGSKVLFWHTGGLMNLMAVPRYVNKEIALECPTD